MLGGDVLDRPQERAGALQGQVRLSDRADRLRTEHSSGAPPTRSPALAAPLFAPVDIAFLVYFRVVFGLAALGYVFFALRDNWIVKGYLEPSVHFPFWGFAWMRPWPGIGMYVHFGVLALLACCIIVGFRYRLSATLFCFAYAYAFLLEKTLYQSHLYLLLLLSLIMIFLPADRALSLDVRRNPALRASLVPAWTLYLLRVQLGIVYVYAGFAKLNSEWLSGRSIRTQLAHMAAPPFIGRFYDEWWMTAFLTWGGLVFDLTIVPLLLWRRTRVVAFAAAVFFHLMNAGMLGIDIFPWFMVASTSLFFPPSWPRRVIARIRARLGAAVERTADVASSVDLEPPSARRGLIVTALGMYVLFQVVFPFRHLAYPGSVHWTGEARRFSWHMRLNYLELSLAYLVTDPATKRTWVVRPRSYVTPWQAETIRTPDMILQIAHYIRDDFRRRGIDAVQVRVLAGLSLNGSPRQFLIYPAIDLAAEPETILPFTWLVPRDHAVRMEDPFPWRYTDLKALRSFGIEHPQGRVRVFPEDAPELVKAESD